MSSERASALVRVARGALGVALSGAASRGPLAGDRMRAIAEMVLSGGAARRAVPAATAAEATDAVVDAPSNPSCRASPPRRLPSRRRRRPPGPPPPASMPSRRRRRPPASPRGRPTTVTRGRLRPRSPGAPDAPVPDALVPDAASPPRRRPVVPPRARPRLRPTRRRPRRGHRPDPLDARSRRATSRPRRPPPPTPPRHRPTRPRLDRRRLRVHDRGERRTPRGGAVSHARRGAEARTELSIQDESVIPRQRSRVGRVRQGADVMPPRNSTPRWRNTSASVGATRWCRSARNRSPPRPSGRCTCRGSSVYSGQVRAGVHEDSVSRGGAFDPQRHR